MMQASWRAMMVWVAVSAIGCGGGGGTTPSDARVYDAGLPPPDAAGVDGSTHGIPENPPLPLPTGDPRVTVATFNTALAATIWYAPERKPLIVQALKDFASEVDVICLEEVWDSYAPNQTSGPKEMAGLLAAEYPYAFWDYTKELIWGNGLLILSKHPLYRGRSLRFVENDPLEFCDRMVLGVDVLTEDAYFHVLCTHLQAYDTPVSLAARQAEIGEVKAWADTQGYLDGPTFFLGDMNCGPQTAPCSGDDCNEADVASYQMLLEDWSDPNGADAGVPNINANCTFCQDTSRPMQRLDDCGSGGPADCDPDVRIDHCLVRGLGTSELTSAEIVLDDMVEVTPEQGPDCDGAVPCDLYCGGENPCDPRDTQLSDHKGVKCSFAPPE